MNNPEAPQRQTHYLAWLREVENMGAAVDKLEYFLDEVQKGATPTHLPMQKSSDKKQVETLRDFLSQDGECLREMAQRIASATESLRSILF